MRALRMGLKDFLAGNSNQIDYSVIEESEEFLKDAHEIPLQRPIPKLWISLTLTNLCILLITLSVAFISQHRLFYEKNNVMKQISLWCEYISGKTQSLNSNTIWL